MLHDHEREQIGEAVGVAVGVVGDVDQAARREIGGADQAVGDKIERLIVDPEGAEILGWCGLPTQLAAGRVGGDANAGNRVAIAIHQAQSPILGIVGSAAVLHQVLNTQESLARQITRQEAAGFG